MLHSEALVERGIAVAEEGNGGYLIDTVLSGHMESRCFLKQREGSRAPVSIHPAPQSCRCAFSCCDAGGADARVPAELRAGGSCQFRRDGRSSHATTNAAYRRQPGFGGCGGDRSRSAGSRTRSKSVSRL